VQLWEVIALQPTRYHMTTLLILSLVSVYKNKARQIFGNLPVTLVINISLPLVAKSSVIDDECSLDAAATGRYSARSICTSGDSGWTNKRVRDTPTNIKRFT